MRSEKSFGFIKEIRGDIMMGDCAEDGCQYRPHIVWFEEPVPLIEEAIPIVHSADIFAVVGTSLVVYPAAGLVNYAPYEIPKFIVDKRIPYTSSIYNLTEIELPATEGVIAMKTMIENLPAPGESFRTGQAGIL
jgi:NAD-dependent deacetylase